MDPESVCPIFCRYRQRLLSLGPGPRFQAAVNAKGSDAGFGDGAHRGAGWGEVKRGSGPGRRVAALRAGTERLERRCLPRQQHGVRARLGVRQPETSSGTWGSEKATLMEGCGPQAPSVFSSKSK